MGSRNFDIETTEGGFTILDSGEREDMDTGSRRDTQDGKPRPELVNPLVEWRVAMHYANGCKKYGERNFELGQKTSRYLTSARRHILEYQIGFRDEDHLAAAIWNLQNIIMNEEMVDRGIYDKSIDDFTDYRSKGGWQETVKRRAMEYNDVLRAAEEGEENYES